MRIKNLSKALLIITIISSLTASDLSWAAGPDCVNAVVLHIGDKVTDCDRIGLNLQTERDIRDKAISGEYDAKVVIEQKKMIDLKDLVVQDQVKQIDLWKGEADRQKGRADVAEEKKGKDFMWGILAGIGLTVLSGWAIGQAARH